MWKRPDDPSVPAPPAPPADLPRAVTAPPPPRTGVTSPARLGPSLALEGTLIGEEDLLVEGRFHGEIRVPEHQVTIGGSGKIEGEVRALAIVVEGEVRGNLSAAEQVLVRATGSVHGDIRAPRVALDQGCRFKGSIDMEPSGGKHVEAADRRESRRDERRDDRRDERRDREAKAAASPAAVS